MNCGGAFYADILGSIGVLFTYRELMIRVVAVCSEKHGLNELIRFTYNDICVRV